MQNDEIWLTMTEAVSRATFRYGVNMNWARLLEEAADRQAIVAKGISTKAAVLSDVNKFAGGGSWIDRVYEEPERSHVFFEAASMDAYLSDLFGRANRSDASAENIELSPVASTTGLPGRPAKSWHLIEPEFLRRCSLGVLEKSAEKEGEALEQWMKRNHPDKPRPTAKTIENKVRAAHRRCLIGNLK